MSCFKCNRKKNKSILELREKFIQMKDLIMSIRTKKGQVTTYEQERNTTDIEMIEVANAACKTKTTSEIDRLVILCGEVETIFGQMKSKDKGFHFYIMNPSPSEATLSFITALQDQIKVRLMKQADDIKSIDERSRVLVICSLTSRLECNLDIMKDINPEYHNKIVLVLLYCMPKENLPNDTNIPEAKKICPHLNAVVEMAFHKNIYSCSMNTKALKVLNKMKS